MPDPALWGLFVLASLVLLLTPGPAVLYIIARSLDQGRAAGLVSVLGIHLGTLVHITAAAVGLSALVVSSAVAFSVVKYLGAAYLIWIGVRTLMTGDPDAKAAMVRTEPLHAVFRDGFVVNLFNPKTGIFFLAFLPQFVDVERGAVWSQMVVLGFAFIALGMLSDGTYAFVAARAGRLLRSSRRFRTTQRYVSGGIYIGLGAVAAFAGSHRSD
jgi:threonine/homoserine/homoserine lactone efflux protein